MNSSLQPTMNPTSGSPSTETMNTSATSAPSAAPTFEAPSDSTTTMQSSLNPIAFAPYMTGLRMNQSGAIQYCQSRGHDLVSIHNDFQMNVTNKLCSTRGGGCRIGLRNNDTAGDGQWIWSDGTALDYGFNDDGTPTIGQWPWDDSEPNNNYNAEDGVVLLSNGHGWNDYPGHWDTQWVICNNLSVTTSTGFGQSSLSPSLEPTMDPTSDLYVMGNSTLSFWDSMSYCRNLGMHLASIHSDAENAEADAACTADYCWIGAFGSRGIFNWTDGTKMNYTNWFYDISDRDNCVHMNYSGAWTDIDCDHSFYPLCEKTHSSSTPEATTNSPVPSDTTITVEPTAVFMAGTELMTFDESDAYCKSYGLQLASIHNDADNAAVHA